MNTPKVKCSLILSIAGIRQRGPLSPNGRVFRKLAGRVPNFFINKDGSLFGMTYEEAFLIRFMRWLPELLKRDFMALFNERSAAAIAAKVEDFMPKLRKYELDCPPPWKELQV